MCASKVIKPTFDKSGHKLDATEYVMELSPPRATTNLCCSSRPLTAVFTRPRPSSPSGDCTSPKSIKDVPAKSMSAEVENVEYRASASLIAAGVKCALLSEIELSCAGTPIKAKSASLVFGENKVLARAHLGSWGSEDMSLS